MKGNMFNSIVNKIFFRRSIFKIWCIVCYFISLALFVWGIFAIRSPYDYYTEDRYYNNFIEFIDREYAAPILSDALFDIHRYDYQNAFLQQAKHKNIIVSHSNNADDSSIWMTLATYSCDTTRLDNFLQKYQNVQTLGILSQRTVKTVGNGILETSFIIGNQYKPLATIQIDCNKAKTIPLKTDNYYVIRDLLGGCLITIPVCMLIIWMFFRFVILAPVLWILKKD